MLLNRGNTPLIHSWVQVPVYLTRLGGGVFGNSDEWIKEGVTCDV